MVGFHCQRDCHPARWHYKITHGYNQGALVGIGQGSIAGEHEMR